jgi:hypothetical protein
MGLTTLFIAGTLIKHQIVNTNGLDNLRNVKYYPFIFLEEQWIREKTQ